MQDGSANAKQQIVERIRQSTNILVTVNNNPSVDALSAALSLALMLNKLDKHATAVFSGATPLAINFLEPNKTFENNVDSLRDFIIALDKEKADRLRYKVEDNVVKIFITPYRTTITDKDLQFSQGDFNVDLIIALGVENRDELDKAITAHGRILHDATVATINAANQKSSLGSIDWQDNAASSLCEMLVGLSEALQPSILDQQISTAMLTGIVAATERFSNQHTTPRVMTMAAQLMAAGANQQLIATNLRIEPAAPKTSSPAQGSAKVKAETAEDHSNGEMQIKHETKPPAQTASQADNDIPFAAPAASSFNDLKQALEEASETQQQLSQPEPEKPKSPKPGRATSNKLKEAPKKEEDSYINDKPSWMGRNIEPPSMGGTLSATAEDALQDKLRSEVDERNHRILSHDGAQSEDEPKKHAAKHKEQAPIVPEPQLEFEETPQAPPTTPREPAPKPQPAPPAAPVKPPAPSEPEKPTQPTIEQLEQEVKAPVPEEQAPPEVNLDAARQAVSDALSSQPFEPANQPAASLGAQDFEPAPQAAPAMPQLPASAEPALPQVPAAPAENQSVPEMPPLPPMPPLPDFNNLPPAPQQLPELPPLPPTQTPPPATPQPPVAPPAPPAASTPPTNPNDPKQFRIPGQ